jgi:hypothetical protein
MIPATTKRVSMNTASDVNERVRHDTEKRIAFYMAHPELIDQRLADLDREWDIERLIEVEAPTMSLTGLLLGLTVSRKWLAVPLLAQSMVFLHALQGWYPLLPLFRRMGIRTETEIATERYALKAIRGDFKNLRDDDGATASQRADRAFEAAQPRA